MRKKILLAMITIFLWGTQPPLTKYLLSDLPNFQLLSISSLLAFLFLLIINLLNGKLPSMRHISSSQYGKMFMLGFVGIFSYSALYYYGLTQLLAQEASILNYLWPTILVVFSCIILKEKFTLQKFAAILVSFFGIILVILKGDFYQAQHVNFLGTVCCIFAAICYALFSVLNKKEQLDQMISMMVYFGVTSVFSFFASILYEEMLPIHPIQWIGIIWLGIGIDAIAFLCWALALQDGETAFISNMAYITPFLAMIFSWVFLNESVSNWSIAGLFFIIGGIFLQRFLHR